MQSKMNGKQSYRKRHVRISSHNLRLWLFSWNMLITENEIGWNLLTKEKSFMIKEKQRKRKGEGDGRS